LGRLARRSSDREVEERAARRFSRDKIGHLLVKIITAGEGELDPMSADPAWRGGLVLKEVIELTHAQRSRDRWQGTEILGNPHIHPCSPRFPLQFEANPVPRYKMQARVP
jgi:hypothetical protein